MGLATKDLVYEILCRFLCLMGVGRSGFRKVIELGGHLAQGGVCLRGSIVCCLSGIAGNARSSIFSLIDVNGHVGPLNRIAS